MGTRVTQQYVQVAYQNNGVDPLVPAVTTVMALSGTSRILVDSFFDATTTASLSITATAEKDGIIVSATNGLSMLVTVQSGFFIKTLVSVMNLVAAARVPAEILRSRTSTLALVVTADAGLVDQAVVTNLGLVQLPCVAVNGIPGCASNAAGLANTATFNMTFNAVAPFIPDGGVEPIDDSESLFRMAGTASVETEFTNAPNGSTFEFLQSASITIVPGKSAFNRLVMTHAATREMEFNRGPSSNLGFNQAASIQHLRNGLPVGGLCNYNPLLSEGSTMPTTYASTPGQLTLAYPPNVPTTTLVLRNSAFGESYDLSFDRVNAITRGNELVVFGDTHWPEIETFELSISSLTTAQRDSIISFIALTLGRTIELTDHFGQVWDVIITTPDADFLDVRGDGCTFSWAFTCEGTRR